MELIQKAVNPALAKMLRAEGSEWVKCYTTLSGHSVLFSLDNTPKGALKHFSVSHFERYPTWDEILEIKEQLLGDIDAMMVMPKKEDYVNLESKTFHVWETPTEWGIR